MKYIRRTKREMESESKKKEIVKASIKLFMKYGYQKTTIVDISDATGFSVGSIYNFFGNKSGILCDLGKQIYKEASKKMLLDKESIECPKKVILKYYQNIADEFEKYGREIASATMIACSEEYQAGGNLAYRDVSLQTLITLFEAMQKSGRWKSKESIEAIAEQIQMEHMGIILTWILYPLHDSLREAVDYNMPALLDKFEI